MIQIGGVANHVWLVLVARHWPLYPDHSYGYCLPSVVGHAYIVEPKWNGGKRQEEAEARGARWSGWGWRHLPSYLLFLYPAGGRS